MFATSNSAGVRNHAGRPVIIVLALSVHLRPDLMSMCRSTVYNLSAGTASIPSTHRRYKRPPGRILTVNCDPMAMAVMWDNPLRDPAT